MIYLTYDEFEQMGGDCDLTAFNRSIDRACALIDNATHGRLAKMKEIPQQAKALCRDLVEYFAGGYGASKQVSNRSESAGVISQSESYVIRSTEERAGEIDDMIKDYLLNVVDDNGNSVLYRGCIV